MEEEKFKLFPAEEFMFDLYSARAMSSIIIANEHGWNIEEPETEETARLYALLAKDAFDMTEAMILERRKRKAQ